MNETSFLWLLLLFVCGFSSYFHFNKSKQTMKTDCIHNAWQYDFNGKFIKSTFHCSTNFRRHHLNLCKMKIFILFKTLHQSIVLVLINEQTMQLPAFESLSKSSKRVQWNIGRMERDQCMKYKPMFWQSNSYRQLNGYFCAHNNVATETQFSEKLAIRFCLNIPINRIERNRVRWMMEIEGWSIRATLK